MCACVCRYLGACREICIKSECTHKNTTPCTHIHGCAHAHACTHTQHAHIHTTRPLTQLIVIEVRWQDYNYIQLTNINKKMSSCNSTTVHHTVMTTKLSSLEPFLFRAFLKCSGGKKHGFFCGCSFYGNWLQVVSSVYMLRLID